MSAICKTISVSQPHSASCHGLDPTITGQALQLVKVDSFISVMVLTMTAMLKLIKPYTNIFLLPRSYHNRNALICIAEKLELNSVASGLNAD